MVMLSMMASPTAINLAMQHCLDRKVLDEVEQKATLSNKSVGLQSGGIQNLLEIHSSPTA